MHLDLKGLVEELLEQFGVRGVMFTRRSEGSAMFLESATVALGGKLLLGELGQLSPVSGEEIRFARRGVARRIKSRPVARAAESGEIVQAAAAISVHPTGRGDAPAGSNDA